MSLEAAQETEVILQVSYIVSNASWSPLYDLRVFSSDKSMKVSGLLPFCFHCLFLVLLDVVVGF